MNIIDSVTDIRTYISNRNPGNVLLEPALVDSLAEAIRTAEGRPAWGDDWAEWLDANAERIVMGLVGPGLMPWRDVPLYWLDSARPLTDAERAKALREYRATGGMHLVVCAEPTGSDSPEECERLSESGPRPEEIDWAGFEN